MKHPKIKNRLISMLLLTTLCVFTVSSAQADSPGDTLVVAKSIDDIINMDPAEASEYSSGEANANIYDRLIQYEPQDFTKLVGGVAESWSVGEDGKSITFKIRAGLKFSSGNPVRAEDVAFSLQRAIKLGKTPVFILSQFGWTPENVDSLILATASDIVRVTMTADLSPGLILLALL